MPCYNYGAYIEEAIDSILCQTLQDFEIAVVDDGSTDEHTLQVLSRISHPKVKIIRIQNSGVSIARNIGIEALDAEYIMPVDADDKIAPTYLEKAAAILDACPDVGIVNCEGRFFDGSTELIWMPHNNDLPQALFHNLILISSMFRKREWAIVGGYNSNMVDGAEDTDFWISLLGLGLKIEKIPEELFFYRSKYNSRQRRFILEQQRQRTLMRIATNHIDLFRQYILYVVEEYYNLERQLREYRDYKRRFGQLLRYFDMAILAKRSLKFQQMQSNVDKGNSGKDSTVSWMLRHLIYGWLGIGLLRLFFSRDRRIIVFVGSNGGDFADNSKYMCSYCSENTPLKPVFITFKSDVYKQLKFAGVRVERYQNWRSKILLLQAGYIVIDDIGPSGYFAHYVRGAKIVQLWRFVGDSQRSARKQATRIERFINRFICSAEQFARSCNWLVSSSNYYLDKLLKSNFKAKYYVNYGCPRNDVLFREPSAIELLGCDASAYNAAKAAAAAGRKIVAYFPEMHKAHSDSSGDVHLPLENLSRFATTHNVTFVVKARPREQGADLLERNIIIYDQYADVQPLLRLVDCLVCDISASSTDYLLLNRPVLVYSNDIHISTEQPRNKDYIIPGLVVATVEELLYELTELLDGNDKYAAKRLELCTQLYDKQDGDSARRIYQGIFCKTT